MSTRYIDAHLHLQDERLFGKAAQIIARAESQGVRRFFCNATRESDWQLVIELTRKFSGIVPFFGTHPWQVETVMVGWEKRLADALSSCASAGAGIGEIGLDKFASSALTDQLKLFEAHLEIASSLFVPTCIHCVRCWQMILDRLERQAAVKGLPPVMIHSFSGSLETMYRLSSIGCLISYSSKIMNPENHKLLETFKRTPLQALLLETDAPDQLTCNPDDHTERITPYNEPVSVAALYRFGAEQRAMHLKDFSTRIWNNGTIFTHETPLR